ncbi:hypothetical protein ACPVTF_08390 [Geobacillus icigianus]|uniref:Uncharacterized protein n=1 Tax=Geobacillus subterraneus TaxID=129338 RepID=A0A679FKL8_9BACL|nr:hypothetical protein [Geobacillus subterraneus]BBW96393.1 hypothetical protein GsuE55_12260 [Geobacillus subterraneus]
MITKGIQPLTDPLFYFVAPISRYEKRIRLNMKHGGVVNVFLRGLPPQTASVREKAGRLFLLAFV